MEEIIVIMEKNPATGFLEKEIASLSLSKNEEFIVNLYSVKNELFIKLSTDREVKDWEFDAIYDYFDPGVFDGKAKRVCEVEDTYNPTWELVTDFDENDIDGLTERIIEILDIFKKEIYDVYETVKDKEGEYTNG